MAKQKVKMRSMFDPPEEETSEVAQPEPVTEKIKNPCPKCGGRSLPTRRSFEHGGATHYCATACLSEDRMDNFYFTPKVETFDEQAEREEAKKIVASEEMAEVMEGFEKLKPEMAVNLETGQVLRSFDDVVSVAEDEAIEEALRQESALSEEETPDVGIIAGEQQSLIETGEKWEKHWRGMPEFVQEDLAPFASVVVNFESREDMDKFSRLIKQRVGLNTRSIWYPEQDIATITTRRYVEKEK